MLLPKPNCPKSLRPVLYAFLSIAKNNEWSRPALIYIIFCVLVGKVINCGDCGSNGKTTCNDCDGTGSGNVEAFYKTGEVTGGKCVTCKGKGEVICGHEDAGFCSECGRGLEEVIKLDLPVTYNPFEKKKK